MRQRTRRVAVITLFIISGVACYLSNVLVRASLEQDLLKEAISDQAWIIEHRRALHQIPELKYEEHATSKYIR